MSMTGRASLEAKGAAGAATEFSCIPPGSCFNLRTVSAWWGSS